MNVLLIIAAIGVVVLFALPLARVPARYSFHGQGFRTAEEARAYLKPAFKDDGLIDRLLQLQDEEREGKERITKGAEKPKRTAPIKVDPRWYFAARVGFSAVAILAALWVILSKNYPESELKWAYGMVGLVIGHWFKA